MRCALGAAEAQHSQLIDGPSVRPEPGMIMQAAPWTWSCTMQVTRGAPPVSSQPYGDCEQMSFGLRHWDLIPH